MRFTKRLSAHALLQLGDFRRWRRKASAPVAVRVEHVTLCGTTVVSETVELQQHDDRDAARGIVHSAIVLLLGYAALGVLIATTLAGCGGGGGSSGTSAEKPAASAPPINPTPPASPPATPEPGAFKTGSKYCLALGADAVCRVGESDSTWIAARDMNAARIAPVHFAHVDGTYSGTLDGVPMTISVTGATLTGQSASGCTVNGTWTTANGLLFDFTGSASCAGGVQLAGLIVFVSSDGGPDNGVRILLAARGGSDARISFVADGAPNPQPTATDCNAFPKPANETRFTGCPANTSGGSFVQTRVAVCSNPPAWSFGPWSPASPSASECPPIVAPPPTCGAKPADGVRTSTECPAGLQGSWQQTHGWTAVVYPTCWQASDWTPTSAPADACQLPPDPVFPYPGRWGYTNGEFCDITGDGQISCTLSYNSSAQIMVGSVLPNGTGTTRAFKDGVFGPSREWQFVEFATDPNFNRLTLVFQGAGAPPGSGVLAEMRRVVP